MVRTNAEAAGIADLFDELLSTEVNGTFKPDRRAYALGMERLNLKKEEIVFAASAGWDAYGAKTFGYHDLLGQPIRPPHGRARYRSR